MHFGATNNHDPTTMTTKGVEGRVLRTEPAVQGRRPAARRVVMDVGRHLQAFI